MKNNIIKKMAQKSLYLLPHVFAHSLIYYYCHGRKWNSKFPELYDEKIHWHIVNTYNQDYAKYADKYLVRKFVEDCGLTDYLIPLYGVYNRAEDIDFQNLPEEFVLMTNHGSGSDYYEICRDKSKLDIKATRDKMNTALSLNYSSNVSCEYHYQYIKPVIMCEKLLKNDNQDMVDDFKVVCSYGKCHAILVCKDRDRGRAYYSPNWEHLDYCHAKYECQEKIKKPELLDEMLSAAAILSASFPLARIDFYIASGKLYFGEITLTPSGGNHKYLNEMGQYELGKFVAPHWD